MSSIIHNRALASELYSSISYAFHYPGFSSNAGKSVWKVFLHSLHAAIREIEQHPRGQLFRRLIEFGPLNPGEPEKLTSDRKTVLSDPECAQCIEFIYSFMVNRFKGELAELLALQPCIELLKSLQEKGQLPAGINFFRGDDIKEKSRLQMDDEGKPGKWGGYTKGADGIMVQIQPNENDPAKKVVVIYGVIEIKSMHISKAKITQQISRHIQRLQGGVKLGNESWSSPEVFFSNQLNNPASEPDPLRILVMPSTWKLSRDWKSKPYKDYRVLVQPSSGAPSMASKSEEISPGTWKITLAWSEESLHEAAYEMTFWYMVQVGRHIYTKKPLPKDWEGMSPKEAGYNAIKMMLYYILLRPLSAAREKKAIKLYNIYCFGYSLGADSKEMLWPEDFQ